MYKYKAEAVRIVDGDTIDCVIDMGFKITTNQRIRLSGINTPETYRQKKDSEEYKKGMAAKEFVKDRLKANKFKFIIETEKDPGVFGRYLGTIWLKDNKTSLNDELLQEGHAIPYIK
jgi:micrococcal nuclease